MAVDHYENFPVASWLCPPRLRPAIVAIYRFARTADDLADEGEATPAQRRQSLAAYQIDLEAVFRGAQPSGRWPVVFADLARAREQHDLPLQPLQDLLAAFVRDIDNPSYPDREALLDYCRQSANPVGRLLLHLYGIDDDHTLRRSDLICSALQLINFWQDCSVDLPRGRVYLPRQDAHQYGVELDHPQALTDTLASQALLRELCTWARDLMHQGAPLVFEVPGRAGWELRLVVQGGLRVLDKIAAMQFKTLRQRPILRALDGLPIGWRALTMQRSPMVSP